MPEETRYITVSGAVPNGGFPPGVVFAAVVGSPPAPYTAYNGPPPPYNAPSQPFYPIPPPRQPLYLPPPPRQPFHPTPPPGQNVGGSMLLGDLTKINWLDHGERPCDAPNGYFPAEFNYLKYEVASVMRVRDLIEHLGAPVGDGIGITQMENVGNDTWVAGVTITRDDAMADRTLAELGWTQWRSEAVPIWLCAKKPPGA